MKKVIALLITLSLMVLSISACAEDRSGWAWPEMPDNTNPNLKYFGYYHFADEIDEVAAIGNSNLAKVDAEDIEEIAHLAEKGFNIFIMIRHIFFDSGTLAADYMTAWAEAKTELQPYMGSIIGFYVDEPYYTGKTKEAFHTACQTVRGDFPNLRMMAVMAFPSINFAPADYFDYCTDLGYDLYTSWDKQDVLNNIEAMKTKHCNEGQSVWIVPKAFYTLTGINGPLEDKDLAPGDDVINWIKGSYEIAVADHSIAGIFAFVYSNDGYDIDLQDFMSEGSERYRADVRNIYVQIGKAVISNA